MERELQLSLPETTVSLRLLATSKVRVFSYSFFLHLLIDFFSITDVIHMRQEKKAANLAAAVARNPAHQKTTPTRTSKKDKVSRPVFDMEN